ncbi:DUF3558 family protein [Nocardia sp. NPDC127606]|uniref:DUF3558 family protein n=1 Tax=Nocardia sp. NPDC127606 TaxID=3345406 RepID=UPI003639A542
MTLRTTATTIAIIGCAALTGCTPDGTGDLTSPTSTAVSTSQLPAKAVTVPPAPSQPARSGSTVSYDPCFTIGDEPAASLGFAVDTRTRADFIADNYAFIGCEFKRMETIRTNTLSVATLAVRSSNIQLADYRKRDDFVDKQTTLINGREAISYRLRGRTSRERCSIAMAGPDGTIDVTVESAAALTLWMGCDHIEEAARTIEAVLPKSK